MGAPLPKDVLLHYTAPFPDADSRIISASMPGHILEQSEWLDSLWDARSSFSDKPILLIWGKQDMAFRDQELARWREGFPHGMVKEVFETGHSPHEGMGEELLDFMKPHLASCLPQRPNKC